jgi:uncharacterized protein YjbJ (UPF0337 family)
LGSGITGPGFGLGSGSGIVGGGGSVGNGLSGVDIDPPVERQANRARDSYPVPPVADVARTLVPDVAPAAVLAPDVAGRGPTHRETPANKEHHMGEKTDQATGRVKEAAGNLTGNEDLEREGKVERASGELKEKAGDAVDKVKDAVKKITD